MPIYLYWGEDDFALSKATDALRDRVLDPQWASFNYDKIPEDSSNAIIQALNQAMTPPFGMGGRLVWLVNTTICHHFSEELLTELERTLPAIPDSSVLLLTSQNKPDGRLKSTKLLQKYAEIKEFSPIPPWKTDQLILRVRQVAQELEVRLTNSAAELLAQSIGNDTRVLYNELEKLHLYVLSAESPSSINQGGQGGVVDAEAVATLVTSNTQSSLQLAGAITSGDGLKALELVADLLNRNEPALRIVATLTGQFRTWLWVKVAIASGDRDEIEIAKAAEVSNPKRVYFLKKDVTNLTLKQLTSTLPLLLDLEVSLKQGAEPLSTLQTKVIELCQLYQH